MKGGRYEFTGKGYEFGEAPLGEPASQPPQPGDVETAKRLARQFHETYERLAPQFGYKTRSESAVPWDEVPEANKALMVAVCGEVLATLGRALEERDALILEAYRDGYADALEWALTHDPEEIHTVLDAGEGDNDE